MSFCVPRRGPKSAPRGPQEDFKKRPRTKTAQESLKITQGGAKTAQENAQSSLTCSKEAQTSPEGLPRSTQEALRGCIEARRWPQTSMVVPIVAPDTHQRPSLFSGPYPRVSRPFSLRRPPPCHPPYRPP
eukprot:4726975-Pyramimonas_sp.AAC.1